jgi:hypothetical protein
MKYVIEHGCECLGTAKSIPAAIKVVMDFQQNGIKQSQGDVALSLRLFNMAIVTDATFDVPSIIKKITES